VRSTFFWFFLQYPTKALAPLMLEDYRKVMVDRKGEQEQFSVLQIQQCMKRGQFFFSLVGLLACTPACLPLVCSVFLQPLVH
jgi:hypothetical protein